MDTGTESGGGDAFAARVMKKAREVQHAAVQSRAYEIGDGGPTTLDRGEELAMYGTQTGKVTGGDVLPGSRGYRPSSSRSQNSPIQPVSTRLSARSI